MSDGATTMLIGGVLAPGAICPRVTASEKRQVLAVLSEVAARTYRLKAAEVLDALMEREAAASTGVGHGVALPHAIVPGVTRVSGVFLRLNPAIDYQAVDEEPVDLVLALLAPPSDAGNTCAPWPAPPARCVRRNFAASYAWPAALMRSRPS